MKIKRQKHVKRVLLFYKNNFGAVSPYNILVDGTFCRAALKCKVNIADQLPKYLCSEIKLSTTKCAKAECEALGSLLYGPLKILNQFHVVDCEHQQCVPAARCLSKLARLSKDNRVQHFIGTQDPELSEKIRTRPGVPLIFISHNAIVLENVSEKSREFSSLKIMNRIEAAAKGGDGAGKGKDEKTRKRRKMSGPNPLSCKKKKLNPSVGNEKDCKMEEETVKKRKRKRRRVRLPQHVREALTVKETNQEKRAISDSAFR